MNPAALDQMTVASPVEDLSPFLQSLKDQQAKRAGRGKRVDEWFGPQNAHLTMGQLQAKEDEKALLLKEMQYGPAALPTPAEQIVRGMPIGVQPPFAPAGGPVGAQPPNAPAGGPLGHGGPIAPTAEQAAYTEGPESAQARGALQGEYGRSPVMREADREPVSGKDALVATILSVLFPSQSGKIAAVPGQEADRRYADETGKAQRQFALDERSHRQRLDVLRALLESAQDSDKRRFESDKFNVGERNDVAASTYAQEQQTERTRMGQEGQTQRAGMRADSQEMTALLRATGSSNPHVRADAASRLKLEHGFDIYDPAAYASLTPGEKLAVERASDLREKRPVEIERVRSVILVNKERADYIHKQVEHFEEGLRLKAAMLRAYLANIESMIADRSRKPYLEADKDWRSRLDDQRTKAEKEIEGFKKDKRDKRDELTKMRDAVESGYYNGDDLKYANRRIETLQGEIADIDGEIQTAEEKLTELDGTAPADPMRLDPTLTGPIGRTRRGLQSLAGNPYGRVV